METLKLPIHREVEITDQKFHTIVVSGSYWYIYFKHPIEDKKCKFLADQDDINLMYQLTKEWQTVE